MSTKNDGKKPSETAENTDAPKVKARRLATSVRAGLTSSGTGDGGGDPTPVAPSDGGGTTDGDPIPYYVTYGSLNTWGCRG